eukprot:8986585-Alexandrium_andersonii.AAC.1
MLGHEVALILQAGPLGDLEPPLLHEILHEAPADLHVLDLRLPEPTGEGDAGAAVAGHDERRLDAQLAEERLRAEATHRARADRVQLGLGAAGGHG